MAIPRLTADVETASDEYAMRFAGAVGKWMLQIQEAAVLRCLAGLPAGSRILEVGGGHAQLAPALIHAGFQLTETGSADSCKQRLTPLLSDGRCRFVTADHLALPFGDREFAAVVCIRLLMHCDEHWPALIRELCRVAAHDVIVDYPARASVNFLANRFFRAKRRLEGNTRTFRLFTHSEIEKVFAENGFTPQKRVGQFFWPMVLHRMLQSPPLSMALEAVPRFAGLTRRWGSPVILHLRRSGFSHQVG